MLLEVETGKGRSDIVVARKDRKMGFIVEVKQVKKTMKRQNLDQVLGNHALEDYDAQYRFVMRLIEEGKIRPVKSSGRNGKKPALYTEYHIIEEDEDDSGQEYELIYQTDPRISVYYYLEQSRPIHTTRCRRSGYTPTSRQDLTALLYANEVTPDGYTVDANGAWVQ